MVQRLSDQKGVGFVLISTVLLTLLAPSDVHAAIPQVINYQSRLRNSALSPITTNTSIQFTIYNSLSGGAYTDPASSSGPLVWKEVHDGVTCPKITPDADGYFAVQLGACTAFPSYIDWNQPLYIGVRIESDAEATPRVLLAAFQYALNADAVDTFSATSTATANTLLALDSNLNFNILSGSFGGAAFNLTSSTADNTIAGNLSIAGNTTLGNASTSLVTVNGRFNSDLIPNFDLAYSLGTSTQRWNAFLGDVSAVNSTSSNFYTTNLSAGTGALTNLGVTNVTWTNATGTNSTTTNLFATRATIQNLSLGNTLTVADIIWTNATGTNTTSTNLFASNSIFTNATATNLGATSITASTVSSTNVIVNGKQVCLADGTNCTATSFAGETLAAVTSRGSFATSTLQFYGGFIASSSTVTSTFTVLGTTNLKSETFTDATGTTLFGSTISGTTVSSTNIFAITANFATATVAGRSLCLSDGTNCVSTSLVNETLAQVSNRGTFAPTTPQFFGRGFARQNVRKGARLRGLADPGRLRTRATAGRFDLGHPAFRTPVTGLECHFTRLGQQPSHGRNRGFLHHQRRDLFESAGNQHPHDAVAIQRNGGYAGKC